MAMIRPETEMKDSGIEWAGQIPKNWKVAKNNRLFKISKQLVNDEWVNTQLLSLTKGGIIEKNINDGGGKQPESFATYQFVEKDDIVLCLFDIDVSAVFSDRSNYDGMISPAYRVMKCTDAILPVYAKWWFDAVNIGRYYLIYTKSLRKTIDSDGFGNILTAVPPLSEQQAIADYLDETCSKIDAIIAEAKASIEDLEAYKKSLIYEVVTGKSMIRPETEMKDSGVQWLGAIPASWKVGKVKHAFYITKTIVGDKVDEYERLALTLNGVIKRSKEAGDGLQPEKFDGYQILKEHELVFKLIDLANVSTSRVGLSPFTGIVSPAYIVLHDRTDGNPRYSEYYFLSMWMNEVFNHLGGDGVRSALNAKDLLNIPYIEVPLSEQQAIADYLDETCSKIDAIIAEAKASIEDLEAYKKSLIYEVVTGKRRVV